MCGIAGIVCKYGEEADKFVITAMTNAAAHRGPDGTAVFIEENLALGHNRLSILDLSEKGAQPMHFGEKYVIVFNGAIYNYVELREELITHGYSFQSTGDTEVILAAYDFWKDQCVSRFNGMWSFCIYNREELTLFCSRDRFGVKPFYYATHNGLFCFASEIRQILCTGIARKVNRTTLANYLILGLEEFNDETFFQNILRLKPAHNLLFDLRTGAIKTEKYYSITIDRSLESLRLPEAAELYLGELKRSIQYRLRSDVKVGTCLSGGLDSSAIAAIASQFYHQQSESRFTAVTASSIDLSIDERHFAQQVAKQFELSWITTTPTTEDFFKVMDEVIIAQEEPFGSPSVFMQYFVMRQAAEAGCKVLLDGQGGDETLIGYPRYYPTYLKSLPATKKLTGLIQSSANSGLSPAHLLKSYFYFTNADFRIKRQMHRTSFLTPSFQQLIDRGMVREIAASYSNIRKLQQLEITSTQLPHLLRYEDKNSMHFSIETRLPFLDYKLLETSLSLNNNLKIRQGYTKYILRKATSEILPPSIGWRKNKIGFEAPVEKWLENVEPMMKIIRLSGIINSISERIPDLSGDRTLFWRLYNIAKWESLFDVTEN